MPTPVLTLADTGERQRPANAAAPYFEGFGNQHGSGGPLGPGQRSKSRRCT